MVNDGVLLVAPTRQRSSRRSRGQGGRLPAHDRGRLRAAHVRYEPRRAAAVGGNIHALLAQSPEERAGAQGQVGERADAPAALPCPRSPRHEARLQGEVRPVPAPQDLPLASGTAVAAGRAARVARSASACAGPRRSWASARLAQLTSPAGYAKFVPTRRASRSCWGSTSSRTCRPADRRRRGLGRARRQLAVRAEPRDPAAFRATLARSRSDRRSSAGRIGSLRARTASTSLTAKSGKKTVSGHGRQVVRRREDAARAAQFAGRVPVGRARREGLVGRVVSTLAQPRRTRSPTSAARARGSALHGRPRRLRRLGRHRDERPDRQLQAET